VDLILIRHGITVNNLKGVYYGLTDIDLAPEGQRQAQRLARLLKDEDITVIYSSPLTRSYNTARIINQYHRLTVNTSELIREMDFGQWEGLSYKDVGERWPKEYKQWCDDWIHTPPPGGKAAIEMYQDIKAFLGKVTRCCTGTVAVVTHHGCIRMMIAQLLGLTIDQSWRFKVSPGSLSRVQWMGGYGVLTALNLT
jgi:alpha-ribazole phosphatase